MKILHDILSVDSSTATSEASGYPKENATDITNFKQWRSTSLLQQTIVLNFTGTIDSISIYGANFSDITIAGTPQTLVKDPLMGDYRGYFSVSETSFITLIITVQTPTEGYYKISAIAIGDESPLEKVVYPFKQRLVNPTYQSNNDEGAISKTSKGENYRVIEIQRQNLDYSGIGDLSEIKQIIKKSQTLVLFADDGNVGECYLGTRIDNFKYSEKNINDGYDNLILEETGGKPVNLRQLIEIDTTEWGTLTYAIESIKFPISSPVQYKRMILRQGSVKDALQDDYSQFKTLFTTTVTLDNRNDAISSLNDFEDLRGKELRIKQVDIDTDSVIETYCFNIEKSIFTQLTAVLDIQRSELDIWHIKHPINKFNQADYPDIPDGSNILDIRIPYYYGLNYKVPCYYTETDTDNDLYTYTVASHGMEEITTVYRGGVIVSPSEYTIYPDTDSSAYIVFTKEQKDYSGNLYNITADIKGMKPGGTYSENPVTCFEHWLETYVGITVNSSSFTAAKAVAVTLNLKIGGAISGSMYAIDWEKEWLLACRCAESHNGSEGYEIIIPVYQGSNDADFTSDNIIIKSYSGSKASSFVNNIDVKYYYSFNENSFLKNNPQSCDKAFGTDKEYQLRLVNDDETASRIAQYLRNLFLFSDKTLEADSGLDVSTLREGNIIRITSLKPNLSNARYKIKLFNRSTSKSSLSLKAYSQNIFDYVSETPEGDPPSDSALTIPINVSNIVIVPSSDVQEDGSVLSRFNISFDVPNSNFSNCIVSSKKTSDPTYEQKVVCVDDDGDGSCATTIEGVEAGLNYDFQFVSDNGFLKSSGVTNLNNTASGDTTAPATPTTFTVNDKIGRVEIIAGGNTENDFDVYVFYRNGIEIQRSRATIYYDDPPLYEVDYSYQVSAVDRSGNESVLTSVIKGKKEPYSSAPITETIVLDSGKDIIFTGCSTQDSDGTDMRWVPAGTFRDFFLSAVGALWENVTLVANTLFSISAPTVDIDCTNLGFYGVTPVVQQSTPDPAAIVTTETAGATYTSNEQDMLDNLKTDVTNLKAELKAATDALQAYGLSS